MAGARKKSAMLANTSKEIHASNAIARSTRHAAPHTVVEATSAGESALGTAVTGADCVSCVSGMPAKAWAPDEEWKASRPARMAHNDKVRKIVRANPPRVATEVNGVRVRTGTATPILKHQFTRTPKDTRRPEYKPE
jgi:hypothetical protein